jgi:hypothetical protein
MNHLAKIRKHTVCWKNIDGLKVEVVLPKDREYVIDSELRDYLMEKLNRAYRIYPYWWGRFWNDDNDNPSTRRIAFEEQEGEWTGFMSQLLAIRKGWGMK